MKNLFGYSMAVALVFSVLGVAQAKEEHTESDKVEKFSPEQIHAVVGKELAGNEKVAAMRVYGLICESCAIGIHKKVKKLKAIDASKFDKGLKIDTKHQLLYVAVQDGAGEAQKDLVKAVEKAGYRPVRFMYLEGGKLKSAEL